MNYQHVSGDRNVGGHPGNPSRATCLPTENKPTWLFCPSVFCIQYNFLHHLQCCVCSKASLCYPGCCASLLAGLPALLHFLPQSFNRQPALSLVACKSNPVTQSSPQKAAVTPRLSRSKSPRQHRWHQFLLVIFLINKESMIM